MWKIFSPTCLIKEGDKRPQPATLEGIMIEDGTKTHCGQVTIALSHYGENSQSGLDLTVLVAQSALLRKGEASVQPVSPTVTVPGSQPTTTFTSGHTSFVQGSWTPY